MSEQINPNKIPAVIVSTTSIVPGFRITAYRGIVYGCTVRSRGMGGEWLAGCQTTCGGEVTAYTTTTIESREEAVARMKDQRSSTGC
jgi:uncharacterized protein YbjQ (UPF0145 family)